MQLKAKLFKLLPLIIILILGLQDVIPAKAGFPNQTISILTHAPNSATNGESFTVNAIADSGLTVIYSAGGVCTNVDATFTMISDSGTCTVQYDQAGDEKYDPAPQVSEDVVAHPQATFTATATEESPSLPPTNTPTATSTTQVLATPTVQVTAIAAEIAVATKASLFVAGWGDDQGGVNPCTNRMLPCYNFDQAIAKAANGDTIFVTAETFYGFNITSPVINIIKNLTISGGWDDTFTTQNSLTLLDGQETGGVVVHVRKGVKATIERFRIANSNKSSQGVVNEGTLTILNCMIYKNNAGGIYNPGTMVIENSAIYDNDAYNFDGGGIFNNGSLIIRNSTIANNNATNGGAIMYTPRANSGIAPTLVLSNVTISGNIASNGSGIYRDADGSVSLQDPILYNTLISNNDCVGTITSANNNLLYHSDGCTITGPYRKSDPMLGGFVSDKGYFPLQHGSSAIDMGSSAVPGSSAAACQKTDQLGNNRPLDGNGDTVARCDIGAYEADPSTKIIQIEGTVSQSTKVSTTFSMPLSILVKDQFDTPIAGIKVTFSAPINGASGTFANNGKNTTSVLTNVNGIATTTLFTANATVGNYLVNASIAGTNPVQFRLRNTPGNLPVMYVSPTGDNANTCLMIAKPCRTINGALNKAYEGDTVKVAVGTYQYTKENSSFRAVVTITKSVTLLGGWNTTFTQQNDFSTITGQSKYTGIWIELSTTTAIIERFAVRNGIRGIYNLSNGLTLNKSAVRDNHADNKERGAGIYNLGGMTINNSTISGNTVNGGYGAGIENGFKTSYEWKPGDMLINNSTISGNITTNGSGGGIWSSGGLTINGSTISGNSATYLGGGLQADGFVVYNTIIAGNTASKAADCLSFNTTSHGYNLIGELTWDCHWHAAGSGDLFNIDPKLGTFTGGNTGYYPLLEGSPAIDAGNPATPGSGGVACLARDQRNVFRPQGNYCDIGSYEYKAP